MKSTILLLVMLCVSLLRAQEETFMGSDDIESGGFGAAVVKFTSVNNNLGVLVGARGGWIINHAFSIGIAGYGLANNVKSQLPGPFRQDYVNLGYGGLDLEYVFASDRLIHFSIHSLVGGGVVGYRRGDWGSGPDLDDNWRAFYDNRRNDYYDDSWFHQYDPFFVLEPGVNLDFNITTWFRMSVGASYRYVSGVSSGATTNKDLTGGSGMLTFRFGSF